MKSFVKRGLCLTLFFTLSIILFQSCKKEALNDNFQVSYQKPDCIANDLQEFSSAEDFALYMDELHEVKLEDLAEKIADFHSNYNFFAELEKKDEVLITEALQLTEIHDPYFASVLTPEGEIKIGGTYYLINNEFCFAYNDCHGKSKIKDYLNDLRNGNVERPNEKFGINYENELYVFPVTESTLNDSSVSTLRANEEAYFNFNARRRLKGRI